MLFHLNIKEISIIYGLDEKKAMKVYVVNKIISGVKLLFFAKVPETGRQPTQ